MRSGTIIKEVYHFEDYTEGYSFRACRGSGACRVGGDTIRAAARMHVLRAGHPVCDGDQDIYRGARRDGRTASDTQKEEMIRRNHG